MNLTVIKKAVPWLGTVAGLAFPAAAPLIAMASKALGTGLSVNVPATAEGIGAAISTAMSNPDQLATLKKIDDDFAVQMKQLGFQEIADLIKLDDDDRANARNREIQVKDNTPRILAYLYTFGFLTTLAAEIWIGVAGLKIDPLVSKSIDILLGILTGMVLGTKEYYFGSSSGSDRQTELLSQAPPIPK